MSEDFESYLRRVATMEAPSGHGDPLFSPDGEPVSEAELVAAEQGLGSPLPASYKLFLRVLGPGYWCGDNSIPHPSELFAFDEAGGEVSGFIALVEGVRGLGDHLAINPGDPEVRGERPVYYCGHDPLGYTRVADSFEMWARNIAAATLAGEDFYQPFEDAVYQKWKEHEAARPKKWWQFWR